MGSFRPLAAPDSCGVKASEVVDIPYSLDRSWRRAIRAELDAAEEELPRLSKAAFELAALIEKRLKTSEKIRPFHEMRGGGSLII